VSHEAERSSVRERTHRCRARAVFATTIGPWSATVERVVARALLRFRTLPRNVRFLWIVAAFMALNVSLRLVS